MSWPPAESVEDEEARPGAPRDRWERRRGEPRVFALLLSLFLLAGAMTTVFSAPAVGAPSEGTFRRASGMLLVLIALAIVAVWPMVRLSQAPPRRPVVAALGDWVIVSLLALAVVWPATLLPGGAAIRPAPWLGLWPWSMAAGLGLAFVSWALLFGSVIACGTAARVGWGRAGWMVVCVGLSAGAPITALLVGAGYSGSEWWSLMSPALAPGAMVRAPSGLTAQMTGAEWLAAIAPALVSAPVWLLAVRRQRSMDRRLRGSLSR